MLTTTNMGLKVWNLLSDPFDHGQLQANWNALDAHNHTSGQGVQIPTAGIQTGAVTATQIAAGAVTATQIAAGAVTTAQIAAGAVTATQIAAGAITTAQIASNANIDGSQWNAATAQSATVNQSGQTVKGAVNIAASESRTNPSATTYGTMPTPDQVTGIVLPANGLIAVSYLATWQGSVGGAASAAIFLNGTQLKVAGTTGPVPQEVGGPSPGATNFLLLTTPNGLVGGYGSGTTGYSGDVTTGQVVGFWLGTGGPCYIFAAAGTYTVSVQFKASSGSVTASNRKLWVEAVSFA